jgi:hypothetical protein
MSSRFCRSRCRRQLLTLQPGAQYDGFVQRPHSIRQKRARVREIQFSPSRKRSNGGALRPTRNEQLFATRAVRCGGSSPGRGLLVAILARCLMAPDADSFFRARTMELAAGTPFGSLEAFRLIQVRAQCSPRRHETLDARRARGIASPHSRRRYQAPWPGRRTRRTARSHRCTMRPADESPATSSS